MEVEEEADEGSTLLEGASVLGLAAGVKAAFVADADGAAIEGAAMSAYFVQAAVLGDGAILADVVVIADVNETPFLLDDMEIDGNIEVTPKLVFSSLVFENKTSKNIIFNECFFVNVSFIRTHFTNVHFKKCEFQTYVCTKTAIANLTM